MTEQINALDLAEALEIERGIRREAVAELRLLAAENRVLHERHRDNNFKYTRVLAQRDLLLEALKQAEPLLIGPILLRARAAIKAVEEGK